jgi:hypothetical protein
MIKGLTAAAPGWPREDAAAAASVFAFKGENVESVKLHHVIVLAAVQAVEVGSAVAMAADRKRKVLRSDSIVLCNAPRFDPMCAAAAAVWPLELFGDDALEAVRAGLAKQSF